VSWFSSALHAVTHPGQLFSAAEHGLGTVLDDGAHLVGSGLSAWLPPPTRTPTCPTPASAPIRWASTPARAGQAAAATGLLASLIPTAAGLYRRH
jgi:hypothetical protein